MQGSTIIPSALYRDAPAAIEWLCRVFGFTRNAVYPNPDGTIAHAELTRGPGMFMLGSLQNGGEFARHIATLDTTGGRETLGLTLIANEADELYANVQAAGAEIVQKLTSRPHGGKTFACRDLEGHIWWVSSYNPWAEHAPQPRPLDL